MTTCEPLSNGGDVLFDLTLISSAAGSHVSRSRRLGSNAGWLTKDGDGPGSQMSSAQYDPDTSSWRTSQLSFETPKLSVGCSLTFTPSGSMRNGRLSQRAAWVPHTHERGCFLWHTPVARDYKGYTMRSGESVCNQLRELYGGSGAPNPTWSEWLMGFPLGWTDVSQEREPSETPSSPK